MTRLTENNDHICNTDPSKKRSVFNGPLACLSISKCCKFFITRCPEFFTLKVKPCGMKGQKYCFHPYMGTNLNLNGWGYKTGPRRTQKFLKIKLGSTYINYIYIIGSKMSSWLWARTPALLKQTLKYDDEFITKTIANFSVDDVGIFTQRS
jgi:hypothetical protein